MATITKVLGVGKGYVDAQYDTKKRYRRSGGTVAWRCNNPGNVKYGKFAVRYGAVGHDTGGHAVFPTVDHGEKARYGLLFNEDSRYYNLTLQKAISIYAPTSDGNDPGSYVNFLLKGATYKKTQKLMTFTEDQRQYLLKRMALMEGYKIGKVTLLTAEM